MMPNMSPGSPLQPLRIPAGWRVDYNEFPTVLGEADLKEDLLQLSHGAERRILDVGWYPEGDPNGSFVLVLHAGDLLGPCLHTFRSPVHGEVVREIERVLQLVSDGKRVGGDS